MQELRQNLHWRNKLSFWGTATGTSTGSYTTQCKSVHMKHQWIRSNRAKQSAVTDHAISLNHVIDWDRAKVFDKRQRKQEDGPMDQGSDTHQERTKQVDEPRRRVLPISTYLWLLTVRRWWTVVPTKAAVVAKTSTITMNTKVVFWWICQFITVPTSVFRWSNNQPLLLFSRSFSLFVEIALYAYSSGTFQVHLSVNQKQDILMLCYSEPGCIMLLWSDWRADRSLQSHLTLT